MKALLLSIKPKYAGRIISGEKQFEFRKRLPSEDVKVVYLYSSSPVKRVVASADIAERLEDSPPALWERTKSAAGVSRAEFFAYFHSHRVSYAYRLENVRVFEKPKKLSDYGVKAVPQSWVYIDV